MTSKKRFRSLRSRSMLVMVFALIIGATVFAVLGAFSSSLIEQHLLSPAAITKRNTDRLADFKHYVQMYNIASTDRSRIMSWCRANRYVEVSITQDNEIIFETEEDQLIPVLPPDSFSFIISIGPGSAGNASGVKPVVETVEFENGEYLVTMNDISAESYYLSGTLISGAAALIAVLAVVFFYNRRITDSIIQLSEDVNEVSSGNLNCEIRPSGTGELEVLSTDVDKMRISIIQRMRQENAAWRANRDLITSLSHDLRTPLTTLIGYLNLIEDGEYGSPEELARYTAIASEKAMRIKQLSDELFRYFVVYGRPKEAVAVSEYDGLILLEQLLGERTLLMTEDGYRFAFDRQAANCRILVNVDSLTRIFDNLFSNLEKYADPAQPITVCTACDAQYLRLRMSNYFKEKNTESTRIGLETCCKLMDELDGLFSAAPENGQFVVQLAFPLAPDTPPTDSVSDYPDRLQ